MGKNKNNKKRKRAAAGNGDGATDNANEKSVIGGDTSETSTKDKSNTSSSPSAAASASATGSFRSLEPPLSDGILKFLDKKGFTTMTPVQEATIPLFLKNKDVAVQAVTGSGKTLAFLIPIIERLLRSKTPFKRNQIAALILSPTRELAMQTWRVCKEMCDFISSPDSNSNDDDDDDKNNKQSPTPLRPPLLLVGGGSSGGGKANHRPVSEDLKSFHKEASDIIIGTPGRMEDVLTRYSVIDVSELEILVMDEADVLLFGGGNAGSAKAIMDPTISSILSRLPKMRRTGIFSATTTFTNAKSVKPLLQRAGMRNPVLINVQVAVAESTSTTENNEEGQEKENQNDKTKSSSANSYTPTTLTNYYLVSKLEERISRLAAFLQSHPKEKIIVFFLTCACVDFYGNTLRQILTKEGNDNKNGKNTIGDDVCFELLHGKLVQKRREKAMERYREGVGGVLFCTDVAARGLDVPDVDWVVQVDAPQDPSQFVHRVGRSARAGRKGSSLVFLTEKEEAYVDLLANRQVTLTELPENEVCRKPVHYDEKVDESQEDGDEEKNNDDKELPADDSTIPNVLPKIRALVLKDRDMLEKGTKAFTSYIRAYKEHVCSFIFRFNSLDLGYLATSFCLLRLPKMPELNDCKGKLKHFTPADASVDIYAIPYLDKAREVARQKRLASELAAGGKNAKQIKAEMRKAELLRKQKERRQNAIEKGRNPDKKRGRHAQIVDEWEDLAKEERLYKKLRRGKITKEQYENLISGTTATKTNNSSKPGADDSSASSSDED